MLVLQPAGDARLTFFFSSNRLLITGCDPYPCFTAHSGLALHKDGVCGSQVQGAHPPPSVGDSVKQLDILHLEGGGGRTASKQPHPLHISRVFDTAAHMCEMTEKHILKAVTLLPTWRTQQHASFGLRQMFVLFI